MRQNNVYVLKNIYIFEHTVQNINISKSPQGEHNIHFTDRTLLCKKTDTQEKTNTFSCLSKVFNLFN